MKRVFKNKRIFKVVEAGDFNSIAPSLCSLFGFAEGGGVGGAVAGGACETLVKSIGGVVNGVANPKTDKDNISDIMLSYQYLANTLKSHGCEDPEYTDPEKLRTYFLADRPNSGMGLSASIREQAKFVNTLGAFLNACSIIQSSYPSFINDAVRYFFDYYRRYNFNLDITVDQIKKLEEKGVDPNQSFYVINILKGNYQAAMLFGMLYNYGKVDATTYKDFKDLSITATKMLGKQSGEVKFYNSMIDAQSRLNAKMFSQRLEYFKFFIPIEKSSIKLQEDIVNSTYPVVKGILSNPAVSKFLPLLVGLLQLGSSAKYIASGPGQAIQGGLKQ